MTVRLQPLARRKVASLGDAGTSWLDALPGVLDELAGLWSLTWGRPLPGGSASYVVGARTADGQDRVVKVAMPGAEPSGEAHVLGAAAGRGYAVLHAHDPDRRALLLEHLGPSLDRAPLAPETTLDLLVDTLAEAWTLRLEIAPAEPRAACLAAMVTTLDDRLRACDPHVRRQALAYAERLGDPSPDGEVVAHGDPHPANALRVLAPRPGAGSGYVLVDPDGFRCDPAYDLGVTLRDWTSRLAAGGRAVLEGYCDRVAERSGLERERIWAWAFVERVSTGLYVSSIGATELGRRFLDGAELLLDRAPPRRAP